MRNLKLKSGDFISTTCYHRYGLVDSRTNAKMGKHVLEDGTSIEVDINGRVTKADHGSWEPLRVLEMTPIARKMAEVKEPAKKTLPDPLRVYTSQEALDFQRKKAADEKLKKYQLLKRDRADGVTSKPDRLRFR